jgi:hypothetical protein
LVKRNLLAGMKLVHGLVEVAGVRIGHAWIESGGLAFDFSHGKKVITPVYTYRQSNGVGQDFVEYDFDQAIRLVAQHSLAHVTRQSVTPDVTLVEFVVMNFALNLWCRWRDLNSRPWLYESPALPLSYSGANSVYPAPA